MKYLILPILFFCMLLISCNQELKEIVYDPRSSAEINVNDTLIRLTYLPSNLMIKQKIDINTYYHWFSKDQIFISKGNYSGNVLDGVYEENFPEGQLKAKGYFNLGLKDKQWVYYYQNGKIKRIEQWKKGLIERDVLYYDKNQYLARRTHYLKGLKHGLDIFYHMDSVVSKTRYVKGRKR